MHFQRVYDQSIMSGETIKKIDGATFANGFYRAYRLVQGDEVYISRNAYKIKLGECISNTPLMCIRLVKRNKWWQFWKPRYKGAIYRMMKD